MGWFDTHAHLADPALSSQWDGVLERAVAANLEGILCVAVDHDTSLQSIQIARRSSMVRASVGIHPNYAHQAKEGDWDRIRYLSQMAEVVAIGETGLDKYWDDCPFDIQLVNFRRHWELSRETGLPVIIHMRECEPEMIDALRQEFSQGPLRGVMHSFSGTLDAAKQCLEFGLYVSFAGMLTYKKSEELRQVATQIPLDRVLVETDSPYLSPEPHRGKRPNEPSRVVHTAQVLAESQGVTMKELMEATKQNVKTLFSRWPIAA
jgi:TatD DNase family protein